MSTRPEILFPLFADLESLPGVGKKTAEHLGQIGVERPRDLLLHLPMSVIDRRRRDTILGLELPAVATVEVEVGPHRPPRGRGAYRVQVSDSETDFQLVFFHAKAPYLERLLPVGERRLVSGRLEFFDGMAQMPHPDHVLLPAESGEVPDFEPVYPLTHGITQKVMAKSALGAVAIAPDLDEWIDPALAQSKGWATWRDALASAHAPDGPVVLDDIHRERLAYDELFAHQLTLALARQNLRRAKGHPTKGDGNLRRRVLAALDYAPPAAQTRAVGEIERDMAQDMRMSRLLQGDVGSGKTLVAFLALLIAVESGGQGVMMAPTEILAHQHLESLAPLAAAAGVTVECLTGRDKGSERRARLERLVNGDIDILVGTHAVFQDGVDFADLRLAVIDEQHRFGVRQRLELGRKGQAPDMLVMTATPIPRSLELATHGDMDVSVLDEKPPGRKPVTTALVSLGRINEVIEHLRSAVAEGRQAYWVCPLVEESETLDLTAAEERFKTLRATLGEGVVGLVHGQMPGAEKDVAMARFVSGETSVLVATTVIEVGVNVPNASIMVIEQAEIFGLAQLHQLRGRVGRGAEKSTCLLVYRAPLSETAERRLSLMRETEDGFRIAEVDLEMRGAGDVIGVAQSGLPRFRVADLERHVGLMKTAQSDARALLALDPTLETPRGAAARVLLWLTGQDEAIRLISVG